MANHLPVLTVDRVKALINRLDTDRANVQASTTLTPAQKQQIQSQIATLKVELQSVVDDFAAAQANGWDQALAQNFTTLTQNLEKALAGQQGSDGGACFYQGGCLVTTEAQCTVLGGVFKSGQDCQGNPLP
jgi:hypothetical protein